MTSEVRRLSAALLLVLGAGHVATGGPWWTGLGLAASTMAVEVARGRRLGGLQDGLTVAAAAALVAATLLAVLEGPVGRARGFAPHPNYAAAMALALVMVVAVGARSSRSGRLLLGASAMLGAMTVLLAGSRVAIVGAGATGLVTGAGYLWRSPRWRRWIGLAVVLGGAALLGVVAMVASTRADLRSGIADGTGERLLLYDVALDLAARSPWIGLGEGAWRRWQPVVEPSLPRSAASHVHSLPLHLLLEGGVAGLVAGSIVLGAACLGLTRRFLRRRRLADAVALAALGGLALQALVDLTATHWLVYAPLTAAAVLAVATSDDRPRSSAPSPVGVEPTS